MFVIKKYIKMNWTEYWTVSLHKHKTIIYKKILKKSKKNPFVQQKRGYNCEEKRNKGHFK